MRVMENGEIRKNTNGLSIFEAWAFSVGTAIGWGSLVVTANTYLAKAGPVGSVLGLIIGALIMLIMSRNYYYLMQIHPDGGGAYTYVKEQFGHDHGFLTGWFLSLVYLAILWANATAIPLFVRNFVGDMFMFGRMYTLFGYDVYFGETALTIVSILLIAVLCYRGKRLSQIIMTMLVAVFTCGIFAVFVSGLLGNKNGIKPDFVPDTNALSQIINIAVISPWAFIGFESISHSVGEFSFKGSRIFRMLVISVIGTTLLYIFIIVLSVTAYPAQYGSWLEYIRNLGNNSGISAFPAFYAAHHYLGNFGVSVLMISLVALITTSLIGNMTALSHLFYTLGEDGILPESFGKLNRFGAPGNAIVLIAALSLIMPFVGRTAIGWIVDVTTLGATLIYGFVSAVAYKTAEARGDKTEKICGLVGFVMMLFFGLYILVPSFVTVSSLEKETYFLFILWSVLGFLYFRYILSHDKKKKFGNSVIVWVALLSLVLVISLIWMRQSMIASNHTMLDNVADYYAQHSDPDRRSDESYIQEQIMKMEEDDSRTVLMGFGMCAFAIIVMFSNYSYMNKRTKESEMIAMIDPMTGVKSKHAYLMKEKDFNDEITDKNAPEFAVVVCDVNGLKKINDTLGHKAGDELICHASSLICDIFKHSPLYRVGGDEFVAILQNHDYESRKELMLRLHNISVEHISSEEVVVSGGMSEYKPGEDFSFHDVFQRADQLMYAEKQLLKGLGSITRDENPEEEVQENVSVLELRRQILIVEDEPINQALLGNILEEEYDLMFADDGVEALRIAKENKDELTLVLLDLMLPKMSGLEVLKDMKDDADLKKIPVIVLTADQKSEVECLRIGAQDFIPKPYPQPEIIKARVDRCIEIFENRDTIEQTERDPLTKLYNIEYFDRYANMYDRHYADMNMDAVVIDINRFHMVNERYGKQFGDLCLQQLGTRIRQLARKVGGVGGRRGSDTFLIYCPHRDDYEKCFDELSNNLLEDEELSSRINLRMGIYSNADKNLDFGRRFDRAKMAADSIKNTMHHIGFYDKQLHESALYKERLLEEFHTSVENNDFLVFFQPKFDIRPEKPILASAEALVRWKHPELGMIAPGVFIPLLEESGRIYELDIYVWEKVAERISIWKKQHNFSVPVSVNVSRIDMLMPNLKDIFLSILNKYDLNPDDIILEITESAYTGDSEQVISTAKELRGMGMGFRIEMDDFGTGYSSLGMLSQLPIDALKLDMTFIRNAFGENKDVRMIELIIDIADYLHVPVVAEGVETIEQMTTLKALGCDLVQGYYFSKPVPPEEFDRFLIERRDQNSEFKNDRNKSYINITKALTGDFENIYYIDTVTDYYLRFYSGPNLELEISAGGDSFFAEREKLLKDVCIEDTERLKEALSKENLQKYLSSEEDLSLLFNMKIGDKIVPHRLQTVRTRNNDRQHIVVGIRQETE